MPGNSSNGLAPTSTRPGHGRTASEDLIAAAASLTPLLSAHAAEADRTRRLPAESVAALRSAGFLRLATPRAHSGHLADLRTVIDVVAELARGCASSAWVTSIFYSSGVLIQLFDEAVREQVWAESPDVTACGSIGTPGSARAVDGGFLIDGRWGWNSGAHHARWALLDVAVHDGGSVVDRGLALVPTPELTIEDTWHMAGMRGTGSDTLTGDQVFVPDDHFLSFSVFATGAHGRDGDDRRLTRLPLPGALLILFTGTVLGSAQAALDHTVARLREGKPLTASVPLHARAIDSPSVQAQVAEAAFLIDTARVHVHDAAGQLDRTAREGPTMDATAQGRVRLVVGQSARLARQAMEWLLDAQGAGGLSEPGAMERILRDISTATRHPAFGYANDLEVYGRLLLGVGLPASLGV